MLRNIKLTLCYDGTDYHGWQIQPHQRTIQGVLNDAIEEITGAKPNTIASGRTDAGVHALGQPVHFFTTSLLRGETFVRALNATLPPAIRVLEAEEVPQSFHSTLDAKSKRYRYVIDNARIADPFRRRYCWHVPKPLDDLAMNRAAQVLVGRHDFRSFETEWPNRYSSVRTIFELEVRREGSLVLVEVEADGFLYNMVRSITGTLVLVGNGKRSESYVAEALQALERKVAGPTAPAQGLFLLYVRYRSGL